jgi:UDP-N-acetylglucosamine acyltransferase
MSNLVHSLIHPTAIIDPSAELGSEVQVGAYSIIGPNVKIASRSWIGPHVVIEGYTTLGEECEVFQFASVGAKPQDLKFKNEPSTLVIGSKNKIREYVTIQPGTSGGNMTTIIGDNNLFMANSHIGHDCVVGNNNILSNSVALAGHVTLENNVILGGLTGVHQFVRIGSYAFLGAGSMVSLEIPPYCIGQGDRCHLRGVNVVGMERSGFTPEEISAVRKTYRHLFSTTGHLQQKIEALPSELTNLSAVKVMLDFITSTSRGISSPAKELKH